MCANESLLHIEPPWTTEFWVSTSGVPHAIRTNNGPEVLGVSVAKLWILLEDDAMSFDPCHDQHDMGILGFKMTNEHCCKWL